MSRLSDSTVRMLRCPICRSALSSAGGGMTCTNVECEAAFPLLDGIPVLINESNSLFTIADFTGSADTFWHDSKLRRFALAVLPSLDLNLGSDKRYGRLRALVHEDSSRPAVLIVGGSREGVGSRALLSDNTVDFIEADVSFGPRTQLICDGHDLPFEDGALDAVVVQAVLEHVIDPARCVAEIHRVLKPGGFVYAETPFMQQVHAGRYDFHRFSDLAHRRLFRRFDEIERGVVCGPAMALGHAIQYLILSPFRSKPARNCVKLLCRLFLFWLKYFDYILGRFPGASDAASGCYFLGRRSETIYNDREIVDDYRGAN